MDLYFFRRLPPDIDQRREARKMKSQEPAAKGHWHLRQTDDDDDDDADDDCGVFRYSNSLGVWYLCIFF